MTIFQCQCGLFHDSAIQPPCPVTQTAYFLTDMQRWLIVSGLRAWRQPPTPRVQEIIDLLKWTPAEVKHQVAIAKMMAGRSGS